MSNKPDTLNYGPISKWKSFVPFDIISKKAVLLPTAYMTEERRNLTLPQHILFRILTLARHTSISTLLLSSWGLLLPALALNRVRLEQLIISSYLIHEDRNKGIVPFIEHMPVATYLNINSALSDSEVAEILDKDIDVEKYKQEAIEAMSDLKPGFDPSSDKFQRKWTNLDLKSMARRRDDITAAYDNISRYQLERYYITIYKNFSSVVHSDCLSISPAFLGNFVLRSDNEPILFKNYSWATMVAAQNALFDIVQTFETMSFIGVDCLEDFQKLDNNWNSAVKEFIK